MPIELKIREDLSLNDLVSLKRAGFLVFKTPHVGNWYPNNLACAQLGIAMKVVDSTKGCLDRNFHPHCVIIDGKCTQIAEADVLVSHAKVTRIHPHTADRFTLGASISDAHIGTLSEVFPGLEIQTVSAYLKHNAARVIELLEVLTRHDPTIWERFVNDEGVTVQRQARDWKLVESNGVFGTNGSRSGWVSPNIANILMDVTIDMVIQGTDVVYELSGPDMFGYIGKLMPKLNELYELVRRTLNWRLPKTAVFNIVPVAEMRFAVPPNRRSALEDLVKVLVEMCVFRKSASDRIRVALDRDRIINLIEHERHILRNRLVEAVQICPDPFYNIYDGTFFSQYDLFVSPDRELFIHPWALDTPVGVLSGLVRLAMKLRSV